VHVPAAFAILAVWQVKVKEDTDNFLAFFFPVVNLSKELGSVFVPLIPNKSLDCFLLLLFSI
jgi:hypothetical protein